MRTDYHTHTFRCGHAEGTTSEYIEAAIAAGIEEIGLTDHLWLYFEPVESRNATYAMAESDYDVHYAGMLEARERYRGQINVRVSVEADYIEGREDDLRSILSRYEFDYILGSVHFMDGWVIDAPEYADRYREQRVAEIYRRYFAKLQKAIRTGLFDLIAHFDLPKKFGFLPEEDLSELVGETLDLVLEHDLAMEVSTAGLRKPIGEIYPAPRILREMRGRGIPISLSSDAHHPSEVGHRFDEVVPQLIAAGFEEVAVFEQRRRLSERLT